MAFALPVATEIRGFHGTTPVPIDAGASALLRPVSFPSGYTAFGHFEFSFWHYYLREKMDISGYGQNVLGAMTVAIIGGVAWCVRNKFKHSNCELDSGCLKVTSHEDDETRNTIRREILEQLRAEAAPEVEQVAIAVSETNL